MSTGGLGGGGKKPPPTWSKAVISSALEATKTKKKEKKAPEPEPEPVKVAEPKAEMSESSKGGWSSIVAGGKSGGKKDITENKPPAETAAPKPGTSGVTATVAAPAIGAWGKPRLLGAAAPPAVSATPSTSGLSVQKDVAKATSAMAKVTLAPTTSAASYGAHHQRGGGGGGAGRGGPGFKRGGGNRGPRRDRPDPDLVENQKEIKDFVHSRPKVEGILQTKQGKLGKPVDLTTNYYALEKMTNFNLFHYHVEFKPNEERTDVRKKLVRVHEQNLGAFIFDGQALYSPNRIQIKQLYSKNPFTEAKTQINLKLVAEISPIDPIFLQVYNIIFRNIMVSMDLELMGRFYYDPFAKTRIPSRKLEVWPGYITSVRNHENQVLLNVEVTHKVVRSDSVLDFIQNVKKNTPAHGDYRKAVTRHLLGSVVVTTYNKKNYRIDDIKWDVTPIDEFQMRGGVKKSYKDYYKEQYGCIIKDLSQPMLVSLPKKKDYHRGSNQPIYLVPEMAQMTGLSEQMRSDVSLMKDLASHLIMSPTERIRKANGLITRWYNTEKVKKELILWNIQVCREPTSCRGRIVDLDELVVGPGLQGIRDGKGPVKVKQDKPGEWTNVFKQRSMLSCIRLQKWVMIYPPNYDTISQQMLESMRNQGKSMGFIIDEPMKFKVRDTKPTTFAATIQNLYLQLNRMVQMFLVILPNGYPEAYTAIKKKCYCELGVSCQCVIVKTLQTKNMISVTSRIAIQMNAKLGGEPWTVEIPLRDIMIVGYDVFHSPNKRTPSVGALVASTSPTLARYFTSTYFHKSRNELSANLCSAMTNALQAYKKANQGRPPARIILYRDGVGDGQLSYIYTTELDQIKEAIRSVYANDVYPMAKFSFIVVTKRIHTRIFQPIPDSEEVQNPPPGTIVDDIITLPERYDFFLVSQSVNTHGTVSPTSYNVLSDEQGLDPDKMQRLTLKLCHLYFNYTGTIAVPAPCQFAHKLAYLTGMSLNNSTHQGLQNLLYFL